MKSPTEIFDSISDAIKERVGNPFVSTYLMSWGLVNYRVVLYTLSDESVSKKISFIDCTFFPNGAADLDKLVLIPFGGTLFYLMAVPFLTAFAIYVRERFSSLNSFLLGRARNKEFLTLDRAAQMKEEFEKHTKEIYEEKKRAEQALLGVSNEINSGLEFWARILGAAAEAGLKDYLSNYKGPLVSYPMIGDHVGFRHDLLVAPGFPENWVKALARWLPEPQSRFSFSSLDLDDEIKSEAAMFITALTVLNLVLPTWEDHDPYVRPRHWDAIKYIVENARPK